MPSPAGWREVPCIECGRFVSGIDFVERCAECTARRKRRAQRIAGWCALGATAVAALWILHVVPTGAMARWYSALGIASTYFLVRLIVRRVAMEVLP